MHGFAHVHAFFFITICEHTYTQVCTWVCVHVYTWQCYVAMRRQIHAWVFSRGPTSTCTCVFCYIWGKCQPPHMFSLSLLSECQAGSPPAWVYSYPDSSVQWRTEGWRFSEDWEDLNHSFLILPLFLSLLFSYHSKEHLGTEKKTWRLVKRDSSICLASSAGHFLGSSVSLLTSGQWDIDWPQGLSFGSDLGFCSLCCQCW